MGISAGASSFRAVTKMDQPSNFKIATFAMGCFWHPDALFGCQKGVHRTRVGYTGGAHPNPTYRNLGDHTEAIEIDYDPDLTSYEKLLQLYWENHDPTEVHKRQYRSAIFYRNEEEKKLALDSKQKKEKLIGKPVVTAIEPFVRFYNAENYHQKYYLQTHHEKLFKSLGIKQSDLIDSTLAAKLNGYLIGLNTVDAFNAECQAFGLSPKHIDYVRQMIAKGKRSHC